MALFLGLKTFFVAQINRVTGGGSTPGMMDFSARDNSGLLALLEDI